VNPPTVFGFCMQSTCAMPVLRAYYASKQNAAVAAAAAAAAEVFTVVADETEKPVTGLRLKTSEKWKTNLVLFCKHLGASGGLRLRGNTAFSKLLKQFYCDESAKEPDCHVDGVAGVVDDVAGVVDAQ
jgi:hypothetical protein